jgi:uncharacterized protein (TIGR03067 family)
LRYYIVVFAALSVLVAAEGQGDAVKSEMEKLQGKWVRIYVDVDGKKSEDGKKEANKAVTLTIKGDKYDGDSFKIDPTKTPKHIDVSSVDAKGKATNLPGIYELKGDVLKLCFPFPFGGRIDKLGKRPTEFGSKKGGDEVLEVYRRLNE